MCVAPSHPSPAAATSTTSATSFAAEPTHDVTEECSARAEQAVAVLCSALKAELLRTRPEGWVRTSATHVLVVLSDSR